MIRTVKEGRRAVATLPALRHSWQLPFPYVMVNSLICRIGMLFYSVGLGAQTTRDFSIRKAYTSNLGSVSAYVYPMTHIFHISIMVILYQALFRVAEKLIEPLLDRRTGIHLVHIMKKTDTDTKSYMIAAAEYDNKSSASTPSRSRSSGAGGNRPPTGINKRFRYRTQHATTDTLDSALV